MMDSHVPVRFGKTLWPLLASLLACGCLDDLQAAGKVASIAAIPVSRELTAKSGDTVEIGLQARDPDGKGTNGVDCFFALGDPASLAFTTSASGETTQRVLTKHDAVNNVSSDGLAVTSLTALDVKSETDAHVWAGVGSATSLDATADSTANQVWDFVIHVEPSEASGGAAGGPQ